MNSGLWIEEFFAFFDRNDAPAADHHAANFAGIDQIVTGSPADPMGVAEVIDAQGLDIFPALFALQACR